MYFTQNVTLYSNQGARFDADTLSGHLRGLLEQAIGDKPYDPVLQHQVAI